MEAAAQFGSILAVVVEEQLAVAAKSFGSNTAAARLAPVAHSDTGLAALAESESRIESAGRLGIVGQLAEFDQRVVLHFATY